MSSSAMSKPNQSNLTNFGRVSASVRAGQPVDTERGDFYTFLALDRRTKLIISHLTGKRDYSNTNDFVADLAERVDGVVQITCDGWKPYVPTLRTHLLGRLNLAVMHKDLWLDAEFTKASYTV